MGSLITAAARTPAACRPPSSFGYKGSCRAGLPYGADPPEQGLHLRLCGDLGCASVGVCSTHSDRGRSSCCVATTRDPARGPQFFQYEIQTETLPCLCQH
jgi:hypothetical protein